MAFENMASDNPAFDIEAHRGGRALLPENTLPAFANALTMGVTTLELDLGVTRDGVIVVSHERGLNPDLARNAEGVYVAPPGTPFVELSLAEVKTYDVGQIRPGSAYAARFSDQHAVPERGFQRWAKSWRWCESRATAMCGSISKPKSIPTIPGSRQTRNASSRCCWICCRPRSSATAS